MTASTSPPPPYMLPIAARPPRTWAQIINAVLFAVVFDLGAVMIHAAQLVFLLPLSLLPFAAAQALYEDGKRYCKGSCATLLVLTTQLFAPTTLKVTFEREGQGALTDEQMADLVERDAAGHVVRLRLPEQSIIVSNHQMYADWWYAWCLTYFCETHKDVFIVLKKSLKWVPLIGWAMQFFDFIFLARSWASDRQQLATSLSTLGRSASAEAKPLALLLYPEGTLVSQHTRPVSKKYADKMGLADLTNTLLPRSTGLHYALRALAPRVPGLALVDLTVVYPGVPPMGYAQGFYTLRSIFFDRVPPPAVHVHVRVFDVAQVPIGDLAAANPRATAQGARAVEVDFPEEERKAFDTWVRELWQDKDALIVRFLEKGSFGEKAEATRVDIPVRLKSQREALNAFCFFMPGIVGIMWTRLKHLL